MLLQRGHECKAMRHLGMEAAESEGTLESSPSMSFSLVKLGARAVVVPLLSSSGIKSSP